MIPPTHRSHAQRAPHFHYAPALGSCVPLENPGRGGNSRDYNEREHDLKTARITHWIRMERAANHFLHGRKVAAVDALLF